MISSHSKFENKRNDKARNISSHFLGCAAACLALAGAGSSASAQVPAVVATSATVLATGVGSGPAVTDSCGNVYVYAGGGTGVVRISAATGAVTTVVKNTQGYGSAGQALYMNPQKTFLYFPDFGNFFTAHFDQAAIVNCNVGTINANFGGNLGSLNNYYYGTAQDVAADAAGNVYFNTTANAQKAIYKEAISGTTYTPSQIFTGTNNIKYIASDAAGDIFFVDTGSQAVYSLYLASGKYPTAASVFLPASNFSNITGLSFDAAGNLYITDGNKSIVFEVPAETVAGATALNPADLFATASIAAPYRAAVDVTHTIYLANNSGPQRVRSGASLVPSANVGSSSTSTISYIFNAATTPTAISVANAGTPFTITGGTCAANVAQTALSACTVTVRYAPTAVGLQKGAVNLTTASSTLSSSVWGIGQGAAVSIDQGKVINLSTAMKAPAGITVDLFGNVFVTDTTANSVTRYPANSGSGTVVSTGSLSLTGPKAVAVDNQGDLFIADTGNNRIVVVPYVNGALSGAGATTLSLPSALRTPGAVAFDGGGNLVIADTGNNNILLIPNINGVLTPAAAQSFGASLNGPSALAFDAGGNLFVAESGLGDVLEFTGPLGSNGQIKVVFGLTAPGGLATDASGSLIVVDSGNSIISRYTNSGGVLGNRIAVGSTVPNPTSVALDAAGNLYVTDASDSLYSVIPRVTSGIQFGGVSINTTATQTATLSNSGTTGLTFPAVDYTVSPGASPGFAVTQDTCAGTTVAPGANCSITATYSPTATLANAEEDLRVVSNGANGSAVVQLIASAVNITQSTLTLVRTSPAGSVALSVGQAVSYTATVGTGSGTAAAGGAVRLYVNGIEVSMALVKNNAATITLKNGLAAGTGVPVLAVYSGDTVNYTGSSAQLLETINPLPDTIALGINAPWNNPFSANDSAANATGPSITLTATVVPSSAIPPGGLVTFYNGSSVLGIVSLAPSSAGTYTAVLTVTSLRAGSSNRVENGSYLSNFNLSAVYSGDASYYASTSPVIQLAIVGANTSSTGNSNNTTGATFSLSPASTTITVNSTKANAQSGGSANLTATSYGGWSGVLNFTCSGLPQYATCSFLPGAPLITASTPTASIPPTTFTLTINTNVAPPVPTGAAALAPPIAIAAGLLLVLVRRRSGKLGRLRLAQPCTWVAALLLMVAAMTGLSSCSSGIYQYVTPAGTSTVTVNVQAAQLVSGTTTGQVQTTKDVNIAPINVTLVVQ